MPDIHLINDVAPYGVLAVEEDCSFTFSTDSGILYSVSFLPDDMVRSGESYQFVITNKSKKRSSRDLKLRDTIAVIIKEFFAVNNSALLYLCDATDGKQAFRSRLFQIWFASTETSAWYLCRSLTFVDNDGRKNYLSVILREDNPNLKEIINEFEEASIQLANKPA